MLKMIGSDNREEELALVQLIHVKEDWVISPSTFTKQRELNHLSG